LKDVDVVVLCCDLSRAATLDSIISEWIVLVRRMCKDVPLVLVGCQIDERDRMEDLDQVHSIISNEQIEECGKQIMASACHCCSAQTAEGVSEMFEAIFHAVIQQTPEGAQKSRDSNNCILQ